MERRPLVYLLILNYNNYKDNFACVISLNQITYNNYRLVIIDNNSEDGSYENLKLDFPGIEIIQTGRNLGYAGGNNVGINYALKRGAEYIGILNNDIKVEEDFLEILINEMEIDKDIFIAGPAICEWDKEYIQSTGADINFYKAESKCLNWKKNYQKINKEPLVCDYITGACLLVRTSALKKIGLIPENYFLYFEETEWCIRVKRMGYKVCCIPKARIWHKENASVGENSSLKIYFQDRNRIVFEKRNANVVQFTCCLLYIITQTVFRCVFKKYRTSGVGAIFDGLRNKVCDQYSYVYINDMEK